MGRSRSRSPTRSRSSKHRTSSSYKRTSYRPRSRSIERDSRSSRRSSRSPSKYSSSRKSSSRRSRSPSRYGSSSSKYSSSRRRRQSSSSSSSSSSSNFSRNSRRSGTTPEKKPIAKKVESIAEESMPKEMVFESVNFLHDKDKKVALDDLDQDAFVQKTFTSSKISHPDATMAPVATVKEEPPVDSLLHHGLFGDDEGRLEKWIKKLYNFRQKAIQADI